VTQRAVVLFLALLLGTLSLRTGLPRRELHHPDAQGIMHCDCGCDCDQHPDAADSCLNPLNHEITCGCAKEHREEWRSPSPRLSLFLPAADPVPLAAPLWAESLPVRSHGRILPGVSCDSSPPH